MIVHSKGGSIVPVRSHKLPDGQNCNKNPCPYYPNCRDGDMCQLAHGQEELDYWTGTLCWHACVGYVHSQPHYLLFYRV